VSGTEDFSPASEILHPREEGFARGMWPTLHAEQGGWHYSDQFKWEFMHVTDALVHKYLLSLVAHIESGQELTVLQLEDLQMILNSFRKLQFSPPEFPPCGCNTR